MEKPRVGRRWAEDALWGGPMWGGPPGRGGLRG